MTRRFKALGIAAAGEGAAALAFVFTGGIGFDFCAMFCTWLGGLAVREMWTEARTA